MVRDRNPVAPALTTSAFSGKRTGVVCGDSSAAVVGTGTGAAVAGVVAIVPPVTARTAVTAAAVRRRRLEMRMCFKLFPPLGGRQ